MSRKLRFVQQVVNKVVSMEAVDDAAENVQTEEVRKSADATIEVRQLKLENEAQVRISSLEQDLVEIEGLHEATDELEAAQEEVGDLIVATESYLERGGLTKDAAFFANIALKNATKRVFLDAAMPSMESFAGSSADRMDMTVVSLEGFKETAQKIWKAITEIIKAIVTKVTYWFNQFFDTTAKNAEALMETINTVKKAEKEEIDLGDAAKQLVLVGLFDGKGKWINSGEEVSFTADDILESSIAHTSVFAEMQDAMVLAGTLQINPEELNKRLEASLGKIGKYYDATNSSSGRSKIPTLGGAGYSLENKFEGEGSNLKVDTRITADTVEVTDAPASTKLTKNDFLKAAEKVYEILAKHLPEAKKSNERAQEEFIKFSKLSDAEVAKRYTDTQGLEMDPSDPAAVEMIKHVQKLTRQGASAIAAPAILRMYMSITKSSKQYLSVGGKFVK